MMLDVFLAVVCLASMSRSATSITRKKGHCTVMFVWQKWTVNKLNSDQNSIPFHLNMAFVLISLPLSL